MSSSQQNTDSTRVARDPATQSNFDSCAPVHASLDWRVSFEQQKVSGSVTWTFKSLVQGSDVLQHVVLDTKDLAIQAVHLLPAQEGAQSVPLQWEVGVKAAEAIGAPLLIALPAQTVSGKTFCIKIEYETTEACSALGWLNGAQTTSGMLESSSLLGESTHWARLSVCVQSMSGDSCEIPIAMHGHASRQVHVRCIGVLSIPSPAICAALQRERGATAHRAI